MRETDILILVNNWDSAVQRFKKEYKACPYIINSARHIATIDGVMYYFAWNQNQLEGLVFDEYYDWRTDELLNLAKSKIRK